MFRYWFAAFRAMFHSWRYKHHIWVFEFPPRRMKRFGCLECETQYWERED